MMEKHNLKKLTDKDIDSLELAEQSYGDSWKKRGGVGAFMMLARKWDRLENKVEEFSWDVFEAIECDLRDEGILDDIRDLRRYLLLVEDHMENGDRHRFSSFLRQEIKDPIPDYITTGIELPEWGTEDATDTNDSD